MCYHCSTKPEYTQSRYLLQESPSTLPFLVLHTGALVDFTAGLPRPAHHLPDLADTSLRFPVHCKAVHLRIGLSSGATL